MKKIGFIGVGIMGKSMVRNLMKAGYELHIYARTKAKVEDVIGEGAIFHETISECVKDCEAVITIVGFPQETEEEFEATKVFLEKVHFYEMHIFKYSRRKGTVADRMEGQVDEKIKTQRSAILLELENKMSKEYRQQHIGKTEEVLIEEIVSENGKDYFMGFTPDYIRVKIACDTALDNSEYINTIKKVYMKELSDDGIVVTGIFEC